MEECDKILDSWECHDFFEKNIKIRKKIFLKRKIFLASVILFAIIFFYIEVAHNKSSVEELFKFALPFFAFLLSLYILAYFVIFELPKYHEIPKKVLEKIFKSRYASVQYSETDKYFKRQIRAAIAKEDLFVRFDSYSLTHSIQFKFQDIFINWAYFNSEFKKIRGTRRYVLQWDLFYILKIPVINSEIKKNDEILINASNSNSERNLHNMPIKKLNNFLEIIIVFLRFWFFIWVIYLILWKIQYTVSYLLFSCFLIIVASVLLYIDVYEKKLKKVKNSKNNNYIEEKYPAIKANKFYKNINSKPILWKSKYLFIQEAIYVTIPIPGDFRVSKSTTKDKYKKNFESLFNDIDIIFTTVEKLFDNEFNKNV